MAKTVLSFSIKFQVSHTLLSLMDKESGQPFQDVRKRVAIFIKMLHSGIPQDFNWLGQSELHKQAVQTSSGDGKVDFGIFHHLLVWLGTKYCK